MPNHPVILKALCAGLVGCLLLPLGPLLFPYLDVPVLPFNVIEAVVERDFSALGLRRGLARSGTRR